MEVFRVGVELHASSRVGGPACLAAFLVVELRDPSYQEELEAFQGACQVAYQVVEAFQGDLQAAFAGEPLQKEQLLWSEPSFVEMVHQRHELDPGDLVGPLRRGQAYLDQLHDPIRVPEQLRELELLANPHQVGEDLQQ